MLRFFFSRVIVYDRLVTTDTFLLYPLGIQNAYYLYSIHLFILETIPSKDYQLEADRQIRYTCRKMGGGLSRYSPPIYTSTMQEQ